MGHFTSWPADDRGYYTGVERARERERERKRERETERSWSHFWGKFLVRYGNTHDTYKSPKDDTLSVYDVIQSQG